ncbi:MAG: TolC family protein [Bacteroidia bacterium]|nr:TolC family protein [Bacteroidia bacterium]
MSEKRKIPPTLVLTIAIFWLLGIKGLQAQESFSLTMEECIQYGLDNNLNIKNARYDEYIAEARVKEVLANGYPQVNISADLQYFVELPTSILPGSFSPQQDIVFIDGKPYPLTALDPETLMPIPGAPVEAQFGQAWQSTAGASLNQLVFDGAFFLGLKASKTFVEVTKRSTNQSQEETAIAITRAYYQALITKEQSNLIDANIERLEKLLNETSELNKEGFVEKIDVDRLEINLNNLKLEKEKIKRLATVSINLLKFQMGMPIISELTLTEDIKALKDKPVYDLEKGEFNPENRIEYQTLKESIQLENYRLKGIQVGYYPSLYAFGSYQFNAQRDAFDFFDGDQSWFPISVVGLQLNIPVFDGLRKNAQAQQARLNLKKLDNQSKMLEESFELELSNGLVNLKNAYTSLQSYEKNVELAKRVFDVATIKYREGVGSSLEVNDAESQLKQSESAYLSGLLEYLLYQADYKKARGEFSKYHKN